MPASEVTLLLEQAAQGHADASARVITILYGEIRALAQSHFNREDGPRTLQPTVLVHDACLRLIGTTRFENRLHFMRAVSKAMRQMLVDYARARDAAKRGGGAEIEPLGAIKWPVLQDFTWEQIEPLNAAIDALGEQQPRAREIFVLRNINGMTNAQVANHLEISVSTVKKDNELARKLLKAIVDDS